MEIWRKLRKQREKKGLTYEQLNLALNGEISVSTLKAYESKTPKNRRGISKHNIGILANFFGVPIDYFLFEDYEIQKKENIDIGETLGLSDETIERIKNINFKTYEDRTFFY